MQDTKVRGQNHKCRRRMQGWILLESKLLDSGTVVWKMLDDRIRKCRKHEVLDMKGRTQDVGDEKWRKGCVGLRKGRNTKCR